MDEKCVWKRLLMTFEVQFQNQEISLNSIHLCWHILGSSQVPQPTCFWKSGEDPVYCVEDNTDKKVVGLFCIFGPKEHFCISQFVSPFVTILAFRFGNRRNPPPLNSHYHHHYILHKDNHHYHHHCHDQVTVMVTVTITIKITIMMLLIRRKDSPLNPQNPLTPSPSLFMAGF